ncbi:MAG: hypothetical protein ACK5JR_19710 [Tropicimonas sp.]|uniref:hypothetical protein n=1 Tax=Tropicimonas sp. TaxID=2067044 RepID=UPI003A86CAAB
MSDTSPHPTPAENLQPFTGDRGWKAMERSPGEGLLFAIVVALLAALVLIALMGGLAGIGVTFVVLSLVSLAALVIISMG